MAGDLWAVFKALAEDAAQAGRNVGEALAGFFRTTADKEEENVTRTLETEAKNVDAISAIRENAPGTPETGVVGGRTEPSGQPDPNAVPGGRPTRIRPNDDAATTRSLRRENESASTLARGGYDIEQNPSVPGSKNPDYRIEGQIFDNYAPTTANARNIASWIQEKVVDDQADRIVLNLADSPVDLRQLSAQLHDWPIAGLKEIIVIDSRGNVLHFYP